MSNGGIISKIFDLDGSDERINTYKELRSHGDDNVAAQIEAHEALTWLDRVRLNFLDAAQSMQASENLDNAIFLGDALGVFSDAYIEAGDVSRETMIEYIDGILDRNPGLQSLGHSAENIFSTGAEHYIGHPEDLSKLNANREAYQERLEATSLDA